MWFMLNACLFLNFQIKIAKIIWNYGNGYQKFLFYFHTANWKKFAPFLKRNSILIK